MKQLKEKLLQLQKKTTAGRQADNQLAARPSVFDERTPYGRLSLDTRLVLFH